MEADWGSALAEPDLKDLTSTSFGYVIAFLLPGLVFFYGLGLWYPTVFPFLRSNGNTEVTIGPSVIFLLACLAAGLLIAAIRWFIYERIVCRRQKFGDNHFMRLSQSDKLPLFKAVVDEHYRYHQFYGSMSIALIPVFVYLILSAARSQSYVRVWITALAILLAEGFLGFTARDCYCKYIDRGNKIISGVPEDTPQNV